MIKNTLKIISILLICLALVGCNNAKGEDSNTPDTLQGDETTQTDQTDTKRVGKEMYGYINIPNDWVNFLDIDFPDSDIPQWSDFNQNILSLNYVSKDQASAEQWANGILYQMIEDYGSKDAEGARVNFNGYEAFQVYGTCFDGTFWVVVIFEADDGYVHYISLEGPVSEKFFDLYELIVPTYAIEK